MRDWRSLDEVRQVLADSADAGVQIDRIYHEVLGRSAALAGGRAALKSGLPLGNVR